jgi:hypothetical protein
MRKVLVVFSALLLLTLGASMVNAGGPIPNVGVYFTSDWGTYGHTALPECPPDPPGTVFDSLYVVANNFNMWMIGAEYQVLYPPQIIWLADNTGGINIGASPTGIATTWPIPQNAFVPFAVNKVYFIYNCQLCYEGVNAPIVVVANPASISGQVQAVSWPGILVTFGIGMTSLICPTIPVEETTWGNIKAMYQD